MEFSISFIRFFCMLLSLIFFTLFANSFSDSESKGLYLLMGAVSGLIFGGSLIALELLLKRNNLRTFNMIAIGLILGYFLGEALMLVISAAFDSLASIDTLNFVKIAVFLFSSYFGIVLLARSADEWHLSIPFIQLKPLQQKKKDILLDTGLLSDQRLIDLAQSGLLDQQLVIPRFALKEFYISSEGGDEMQRLKARKSLEILKKLESAPGLMMRYTDHEASEGKEYHSKLAELARQLGAYVLTADISKIQQSEMEGLKIINIHLLSHALKPLASAGEYIQVKIQRIGKEPRQGVGYLEDGTMVVVNGGAVYLGEAVRCLVLSVKGTSSGRIIFCNVADQDDLMENSQNFDLENSSRSYLHV